MKSLITRINFRRRLSVLCAIALVGGFISPLSPVGSSSVSANSVTSCGDFSAGVDFGDLRVKSLHGKAFYTDFKNGLNATYIGYEIQNDTSAALDNIWVQVGNFRAVSGTSVLNLVNNADAAQPVIPPDPATTPVGRVLSNSGKSFVYFLLKASDVSVNAQRHDVRIFRGNPANGGVEYGASYNCYYELKAVKRTLAASANKVTAISVTSTPKIGGAVTVSVTGATGVAGSGDSSLDGDAMWLSPASASSWPTRALRLETVSVSVKYKKNDPANKIETFANALLLTQIACSAGASGCTKFSSGTTYVATYTFRIVGTAASNPEVKPTAQIASGTQMKHTGSYPTTASVVDISDPSRTVTVTKEVNSAVAVTKSGTDFIVGYKITLTNSDASDVVVDEVLDIPQSNVTLQAGSVRVIDKYRTSATALNPEPTSKDSQGRYHFTGPFTVRANATATLTYVVVIPEPTDYSIPIKNTAYGAIGSALFGSTLNSNVVKECALTLTSGSTSTSSSCSDVTVTKLPQLISFPQPPNQGAGTSYELDANSDSGLPITYAIVSGACSLSGLTVIYQAEGSCVIQATQSGNATYDPAVAVQRTVTVLPQQVITFVQPPSMTTSSSQTVTITASSGLPVTLTTLDTSVCKVGATSGSATESFTPSSGNSFVIVSYTLRGNCPLIATQSGDGVNYGAAVPVERIVNVGLSVQVLTTIGSPPPATTNSNSNANWDVSPRINTSSGTLLDLPVAFTSLTPAVCTAGEGIRSTSGSTYTYYRSNITWTTSGLCVIQADQDGLDANGVQSAYGAAEPITTSFTIGAVPVVTIETSSAVKSGATFDVTVVVARPANGTNPAPTGTLTLFTSGAALSSTQQSSAVLVANVSGVSNKHVFSADASTLPATGESGHISLFATFTSDGANSYTNSQTVSASNVEVYSPAAVLVAPATFSVERNATVNATVTVVGNSAYGTPQGTSTVTVTGGTVGGTMPVTLNAQGTATVTLTAGSDASVDMVVNASYTPSGGSSTYFESESGSVTALANRTIDVLQRFTVTYNAEGGSVSPTSELVPAGSPVTLPTPTRSNSGYTVYSFNGWYTAATGGSLIGAAGAAYTPSADITLHAQWTAATPSYTVTYVLNGGSGTLNPVTNQAGTSITLPTPTRANSTYGTFAFNGWFTEASGGTLVAAGGASYTMTADVTLHAQWTETIPNKTVTYVLNGGSGTLNPVTNPAGTSITLPTPTRANSTYGTFAFNGWFTEASGGTLVAAGGASYTMTADVTLHAQWTETIADRTVTYNPQGGSVSPTSVSVQPTTVVTLPTPTRANSTYGTFTFNGWYSAASAGTRIGDAGDSYTVTADITLHAQWTENIPNKTVTYNPEGGTVLPTSATTQAGTSLNLPTPLRTSTYGTFTFNGWYTAATGGTRIGGGGFAYTVTADITLHAQWTETIPNRTVTYNPQGGSVTPTSATVQSGSSVTLPTPTRTSTYGTYTFDGWYTAASGGSLVGAGGGSYTLTADITVHAQWTETVPDFTVNFDPQGGTVSPTSATARAGTAVSLPNPTVPASTPTYELVGWFTDVTAGTRVGGSGSLYTLTTDNATLYARWDEPVAPTVTLYTVTFDANGASGTPSVASLQQSAGGAAIQLAGVGTMTYTNYEFLGWATSQNATTAEFEAGLNTYIPASDETLFAVWKLRTETTYDLNGYVWLDLNANGVQDTNEKRLPGLPLTIERNSSGVQSASLRVHSSSTRLITDAEGSYSFTGLSAGTWKLNVEIPASLQITKNSDGTNTAFVIVELPRSNDAPIWIGITGKSSTDAPVFGSNEKSVNESLQVTWEGIDGKLDTWDDVTLLLDPQDSFLKMSRLPAGRYRLVRLGETPAKSECTAITLTDEIVFGAAIRTKPGVNCEPEVAATSAVPVATAETSEAELAVVRRPVKTVLPDTGMGYSTILYWLFVSLMFLWVGTASVTLARRRRRPVITSTNSH